MILYPAFQMSSYNIRVRFNDAVYRPVEDAVIGKFSDEIAVMVLSAATFHIPDSIFSSLADTESWTEQVAKLLDRTGGCNAWIPARRSIGYTRHPVLITEELKRPSYRLNFQVTPGLVIDAQKLKRQRGQHSS